MCANNPNQETATFWQVAVLTWPCKTGCTSDGTVVRLASSQPGFTTCRIYYSTSREFDTFESPISLDHFSILLIIPMHNNFLHFDTDRKTAISLRIHIRRVSLYRAPHRRRFFQMRILDGDVNKFLGKRRRREIATSVWCVWCTKERKKNTTMRAERKHRLKKQRKWARDSVRRSCPSRFRCVVVVFFLFFFLEKIISRGTKEGEFLRFPPSRRTNQPIKEWEFSPRIYDRCKLRVLKELLTKTLSFSLSRFYFSNFHRA